MLRAPDLTAGVVLAAAAIFGLSGCTPPTVTADANVPQPDSGAPAAGTDASVAFPSPADGGGAPFLPPLARPFVPLADAGTVAPSPPSVFPPDWQRVGVRNLVRMRVSAAHAVSSGSTTTRIVLIDTGVDLTSPRLAGALGSGFDFTSDAGANVIDDVGHGTQLAHAMVGRASSATTVASPCQACTVLPYRVLTNRDAAPFDVVDQRVADALYLAADAGAAIALIGVVTDALPPKTAAAVRDVLDAGVVVIAPAGDRHAAQPDFPARLPGVLSVGASHGTEDAARATSNGPAGVDVWAPADEEWLEVGGGQTREAHASSLAAAYVAGVAGLLKTARPGLSPAAVRSVLMSTAVPLKPGRLSLRRPGGRVDARKALQLVTTGTNDRIVDLSIPFAEVLPRAPLPGQACRIRLRLENGGTLPVNLDDTVVWLWEGAQATTFEAGSGPLAAGASIWLELPWTAPGQPDAGAAAPVLHVTEKPGHTLQPPGTANVLGNDALPLLSLRAVEPSVAELTAVTPVTAREEQATPVVVASGPVRNIAVESVQQTPATVADPDLTTLEVTFTNTGNVEQTNGVQVTLNGAPVLRLPDVRWRPAERRTAVLELRRAVLPLTPQWLVQASTTVPDDAPEDDAVALAVASGNAPVFREAYGDFPGRDVIHDAPYRINKDRDDIPLLLYFAQWDDPRAVAVAYSVYARSAHATVPNSSLGAFGNTWGSGPPIYQASRDRDRPYSTERRVVLPTAAGSTTSRAPVLPPLQVVSDRGQLEPTYFGNQSITFDEYGAWHRVLRLPWSVATFDYPTLGAGPVWLLAQVTVWEPGPGAYFHYWATLRVEHDRLPPLTGPFRGRYYDAHFHTIAEGSKSVWTAQSWAGPLVMLAESAYAHGFIEARSLDPAALADRVVTTDHNQYYSFGPGIPLDWSPGAGPTQGMNGPAEFDEMRRLFGHGAGEEVAMRGGRFPTWTHAVGPIGPHVLVYDADHANGPWHGDTPNHFDPAGLLTHIRDSDAGYAFPAHPFGVTDDVKSPDLPVEQVEALLGLWPNARGTAFHEGRGPITPGYQVWNMKVDARSAKITAEDGLRADAWAFLKSRNWSTWEWANQLTHDTRRWTQLIRTGLHYRRADRPGEQFIRKVYGLAGSDAHGDFNYFTDLPSTFSAARPFPKGEWNRSAWARVRTAALVPDGGADAALQAMWHGQAVVTDSHLVQVAIDADSRLTRNPTTGTYEYEHARRDAGVATFDVDGQMGGGGVNEGLYTALMLYPEWTGFLPPDGILPAPQVRYLVRNASELLQGQQQVREVAVFNLPGRGNAFNLAPLCQIERAPFVDDQPRFVPLFPIWTPQGPQSGASFARAASAQMTRRPPTSSSNATCQTILDGGIDPFTSGIALSNPAWWTAGTYRVEVNADCTAGGASVNSARATLHFANSMSVPDGGYDAYLQALGPGGSPVGPRVRATSSRAEAADGIDGRRVVLEWPALTPPLVAPENRLDRTGAAKNSGSLLLVVENPTDLFGNRLNAVAAVRHLPECTTQGSHCCELNPDPLDRGCYTVSRHGACAACGDGCNGDKICAAAAGGGFACQNPAPGSGCSGCPAGACCKNLRCVTPPFDSDGTCVTCAQACPPGQVCCGQAGCVARNAPQHCGMCGRSCGDAGVCCFSQGFLSCIDTMTSRSNCGACGHFCGADEQCCAGKCTRFDDPENCGACGAACTPTSRCCPDSSVTGAGHRCVDLHTNANCGACGLSCSSGSCDMQRCL